MLRGRRRRFPPFGPVAGAFDATIRVDEDDLSAISLRVGDAWRRLPCRTPGDGTRLEGRGIAVIGHSCAGKSQCIKRLIATHELFKEHGANKPESRVLSVRCFINPLHAMFMRTRRGAGAPLGDAHVSSGTAQGSPMTKILVSVGLVAAISISTVAVAQADMEHRMMRHEMHRHMEHRMVRHEMHRRMEHRMMRHHMMQDRM